MAEAKKAKAATPAQKNAGNEDNKFAVVSKTTTTVYQNSAGVKRVIRETQSAPKLKKSATTTAKKTTKKATATTKKGGKK